MIKEIQHEKDARNKVEESLNEANEKIGQMKTELDHYNDKCQELEKYNQIIKGEITQSKLYIEKLHMRSDKIDEQRVRQKPKGDMSGVGFNEVEYSKTNKEAKEAKIEERPTDEEPKEQIRPFRGRCFGCNKVGHMKRDCRSKDTSKPFTNYCYHCFDYGHKKEDCRKPDQSRYKQDYVREESASEITCLKCNNFGYTKR